MDLSEIARKLGLSESKDLVRKASELRRLCDVQFNSSIIGIGEICKAIICLELAATRFQEIFDRHTAIKLSGLSEKTYIRSFNSLQNSLGVKAKLDIRELGIQFGCVRLIPLVKNGLSVYKQRFIESLPSSRRATADFTRPVFTAVAFYLCSKKHKVSTSMKDICHDVFGMKDPNEIVGNQGCKALSHVLPELLNVRKYEDSGYLFDELSSYKKHKKMEKSAYEDWKSSVIPSREKIKSKGPCKTRPDFLKRVPDPEWKPCDL